jgi:hypothetical protein
LGVISIESCGEDIGEEDVEYKYEEQYVPLDIDAEGRDRREELVYFIYR